MGWFRSFLSPILLLLWIELRPKRCWKYNHIDEQLSCPKFSPIPTWNFGLALGSFRPFWAQLCALFALIKVSSTYTEIDGKLYFCIKQTCVILGESYLSDTWVTETTNLILTASETPHILRLRGYKNHVVHNWDGRSKKCKRWMYYDENLL